MDLTQTMIRSIRTRLGAMERSALLALVLFAAAIVVFLSLGEYVGGPAPRDVDVRILMALRNPADLADPIGPAWFEEAMRDLTALGGTSILLIVFLSVFGFLLLTGRTHAAWFVAGATIGAVILSQTLKFGYGRPRPDLVPHGARVYTQSFPSSHAMMSAAVYLTLAALLARTQAQPQAKAFILAVAALLTALTGASRVYLGVHWPSDVAAGWAAGAAWAVLCWSVMYALQQRGAVEPEGPSPAEARASAATRADGAPAAQPRES